MLLLDARTSNGTYLVILPFFQSSPRQIIRLRVVVPENDILAVNHLLDLCERYPIALRTECNNALRANRTK